MDNWKTKMLLALAGSWAGLRKNIVAPLAARAGTAIATYLVTVGTGDELAHNVGVGVCAAALIIFDLVVSWMSKPQVR